MKLTSLLLSALFATGLSAAPVADAEQSEVVDGKKIFGRSGQLCRVLYSEHVNCRSGPGTNYPVVVQLSKEWTRGYYFTCVKSGECITYNGAVNCGWDYFEEDKCYVNGHATDSSCTLAKLGRC
ncbi:hypothetical protein N7499_006777 [Penicillium canescens]|uniref:Uncharacterized protein n=1 Tax=Penicillium canescens TaxID=5083 RepID=A0AAD6IET4_PENCN|nr:uncharacterized protein N7446_002467 [Penicillium canescens]KAJ5996911.1 hypothetical protein N7522_008571 [Penicillium canescens]KAJ6044271.1 hypothetical protein N7460_005626 [Penicillium canescens]KAJ6055740.1 hypothetical protein N7444_004838 [Penicillium canescens]KAJ6074690.1 hypothetical protein N7446_002467 [Penicillium canescens]KAJ6081903.1 hypothetical protein N7499_006777 [Penicillium canescens]